MRNPRHTAGALGLGFDPRKMVFFRTMARAAMLPRAYIMTVRSTCIPCVGASILVALSVGGVTRSQDGSRRPVSGVVQQSEQDEYASGKISCSSTYTPFLLKFDVCVRWVQVVATPPKHTFTTPI